jgi:hypothetical protein
MFLSLLIASFIVSLAVCFIIVRLFKSPINRILHRLVAEDISDAWSKYLLFAMYVVGISGGVRIWQLEKYIIPKAGQAESLQLTNERWVLEIYQTIIGTLQSIAWMLLVFFIFALLAYVIVRGLEMRKQKV